MRGLELIKNKHLLSKLSYIKPNTSSLKLLQENLTFNVINPATSEILAKLPRMGINEVNLGIETANQAFIKWRNTDVNERSKFLMKMSELMTKYHDDLATIISLEAGKPFNEAKGEVLYAKSFYDLYAEEAKRVNGDILQCNSPIDRRKLLVIKQAIGPVALITPWNFPCAMITRKLGPALAAGCTAVIKPAEQTPLSALALCAIAEEAGLPEGVVNCLTVAREEVIEVGTTLCHSPLLRKLSFTGSTAVGKWLMRESASTVKKISLELGGNAPFLVFDDADLDVALSALMLSKYRNAGQACIASNRVLVQSGVYDKFAGMVANATNKLVCGTINSQNSSPITIDPTVTAPTIGPLIDQKALDKVSNHVIDCLNKGATVLTGGKPHSELNKKNGLGLGGFFFQPTVLINVTKEMLPYNQETFGPVTPLIRFNTEDEAVAMANDTEFGLAAYACTSNLARAWRLSETLEAGMVGINEGAISTSIAPFGGIKQSGIGREGGSYGIEEYLESKYICMGMGKK